MNIPTVNGGFENFNEEEQENKGKDAESTLKLCASHKKDSFTVRSALLQHTVLQFWISL